MRARSEPPTRPHFRRNSERTLGPTWMDLKGQCAYSSPQFNPSACSLSPLTALSIASASSLRAFVSSSSSFRAWRSETSSRVTPRAFCKASSRCRPRSPSIDLSRSGRFLCVDRMRRIAGEEAVVFLTWREGVVCQSERKKR